MRKDSAYDIMGEIDPNEKLDDIQSRLEKRRRERTRAANAKPAPPKTPSAEGESKPRTNLEPAKETAAKKRAADAAKKRREEALERKTVRQRELTESRWITAGHKVREKRVEHLERVYYRLKSEGDFAGNKQEFFDEGMALLEEKYAALAPGTLATPPPISVEP